MGEGDGLLLVKGLLSSTNWWDEDLLEIGDLNAVSEYTIILLHSFNRH